MLDWDETYNDVIVIEQYDGSGWPTFVWAARADSIYSLNYNGWEYDEEKCPFNWVAMPQEQAKPS